MELTPFDVAFFAAVIRLATPILFTAIGELISETVGVINIGLEGMMLLGAYTGFIATYATGHTAAGIAVALLTGIVTASIMAFLSVNLRGDQIVVGVAINLIAAGATLYFYRLQFEGSQPSAPRLRPWQIPLLSDIPGVGPVVFTQNLLVYAGYLLVPATAYVLYRTSWGLLLRSAGNFPEATAASGVSVFKLRWVAILTTGALAGIGGAVLSVGQVGLFTEGMVAGRGFLALAAVVFGGWRPWGVAGACLVFGFADALQLRFQSMTSLPRTGWIILALLVTTGVVLHLVRSRGHLITAPTLVALSVAGVTLMASIWGLLTLPSVNLPSQLWLALPYLLSLAALAGLSGSARSPLTLGTPYGDD